MACTAHSANPNACNGPVNRQRATSWPLLRKRPRRNRASPRAVAAHRARRSRRRRLSRRCCLARRPRFGGRGGGSWYRREENGRAQPAARAAHRKGRSARVRPSQSAGVKRRRPVLIWVGWVGGMRYWLDIRYSVVAVESTGRSIYIYTTRDASRKYAYTHTNTHPRTA